MRVILLWVLIGIVLSGAAAGEEKTVRVFVALCDNKTQGIMKVGEKIGDGDVPDANLYWGCSDGFGSYFKRSKRWKVVKAEEDVSHEVMRRMELLHVGGDVRLVADAYRGSEMRKCYEAFQQVAAGGEFDLVAFIGHNPLMDFRAPEIEAAEGNDTDVMVLSCSSKGYFDERLKRLGCRPVLLTDQLMYPGSFLLHDALEVWRVGGTRGEMRAAAGRAYARNQKISVRAGTGIFADLEKGE